MKSHTTAYYFVLRKFRSSALRPSVIPGPKMAPLSTFLYWALLPSHSKQLIVPLNLSLRMVRSTALTLPFSTTFLNSTACCSCHSVFSPRMAASAAYKNLWNVYFPAACTLSLCSWLWCSLKCETLVTLRDSLHVSPNQLWSPSQHTCPCPKHGFPVCAAIVLFLFICDPNLSSCSTSYAWLSPLESLCQNCDICFINPPYHDSNLLAAIIFGILSVR